jgi:hypothetical protein
MSSPIRFDGEKFTLPSCQVNRFVPLGQQRGNKGTVHTLFLTKEPIHAMYFVGDAVAVGGYCSYRPLYNNNESLLVGAVFISPNNKTVVADYSLSIGHSPSEPPDNFDPVFLLENLGILLFKATDSSILAIPSEVNSPLLIKTE